METTHGKHNILYPFKCRCDTKSQKFSSATTYWLYNNLYKFPDIELSENPDQSYEQAMNEPRGHTTAKPYQTFLGHPCHIIMQTITHQCEATTISP
jgi:hypothetical protein